MRASAAKSSLSAAISGGDERGDQRRRGAEIFAQAQTVPAAFPQDFFAGLAVGAHVSAAEFVNRLFGVADAENRFSAGEKDAAENFPLHGIGVLKFVDEGEFEARGDFRGELRVAFQRVEQRREHLVVGKVARVFSQREPLGNGFFRDAEKGVPAGVFRVARRDRDDLRIFQEKGDDFRRVVRGNAEKGLVAGGYFRGAPARGETSELVAGVRNDFFFERSEAEFFQDAGTEPVNREHGGFIELRVGEAQRVADRRVFRGNVGERGANVSAQARAQFGGGRFGEGDDENFPHAQSSAASVRPDGNSGRSRGVPVGARIRFFSAQQREVDLPDGERFSRSRRGLDDARARQIRRFRGGVGFVRHFFSVRRECCR